MSKAPKSDLQKIDPQTQARILSEALPHMQRYDEEIVVVKYGGHAMGQEQTARDFASDIVLLEQTAINPVVVHGGGPQIEAMLKKLGIKSEFAAGLRITDAATVEIVEMVLAGSINKQIVSYINAAGGKAIGLCGKDGNMVQARKVTRTVVDPDSNIEKVVDLGFVGEPDKVDLFVLNAVLGKEMIPVLAPVAASATGASTGIISLPSTALSTNRSTLSGSPTKPRSTTFSMLESGSTTVRVTLRAVTMLPSLPQSPIALPPAALM